ncbi:transglycosylase domain-containing protein [Lapillicoccus sp.]|uniref:transglycosylase domain-containing protein n=1 Tax=Lapillicoccus sp. TaxID=1909287 RepID=UPI003266660E
MSDQTAGQRPSQGPHPAAPKTRSKLRTTLKWVLFSLLSLVALGCVAIAIAYATISVPQPNELASAQASIVYYDDGTTEMARLSDAQGNRESVKLSQVPDTVQKAVLAAEDRGFYSNPGFSPTGIARSVWQALSGSDVQGGGSTITQQYVKNYFLTSDRSVLRKFKEIIISVKIDQQTSKDQVLENYLNTIYYGRGAYGIQTASKAYFGKDVSQLTLADSAVLASVINAPSLFDPALGTKQQANLADRVTYVLDGMQTEGWITPAQRAAVTGPSQTIAPVKNQTLAGPTGYLVDAVRKELASTLKLSDDDIDRGGLRITTTINKAAQDAAVAAVQKYLPAASTNVQAGLTAIKPGDGAIIAMYGGADFQVKQFNSSTDATMQAGSTFKPFALIGALQQGISTRTLVNGNSPYLVPNSTTKIPNEFDRSYGTVDLRTGLAKSINTVYLRLNEKIGPANTKNAAIAAGIPATTAGLDDNLVNVLGTASPHVEDVANAYATIAANGVRATPYLIASATSDTVDISYKAPKQTAQAFSADIAADTLDAMQAVTRSGGTGARAAALGRPVAGKTGTTDGHLSVWWTGVVPQLSVSVGMYRDENGVPAPLDNIPGLSVSEVGGSSLPLSMWLDFMKTATQGMAKQDFPKRVGIGDDTVRIPAPTATVTAPPATTTATTPPPATTTVTVPPPATTTQPPPTRTQQPSRTSTPSQTTTSAPPTPAPQGRTTTASP